MTERDLSGIRAQIGGIDPLLDQADNYQRGVKAIKKVVREQGQVMSETLKNNEQLYHQNKDLRAELKSARAERDREHMRARQASERVEELEAELEKLRMESPDAVELIALRARTEQLQQHNAFLRQTLEAQLYNELDSDQLAAKLQQMRDQAKELAASEYAISEEEFQRRNIHPTPEAKAEAEQLLEEALAQT